MISTSVFTNCCGLRLLHGEQFYSTAEAYFKDFAELWDRKKISVHGVGALVFEHTKTNKIGQKIAEYVKNNNLGVVHVGPPIPNPVHGGREFHIYTWVHDVKAIEAHFKSLIEAGKPKPVTPLEQPTTAVPPPRQPLPPDPHKPQRTAKPPKQEAADA